MADPHILSEQEIKERVTAEVLESAKRCIGELEADLEVYERLYNEMYQIAPAPEERGEPSGVSA